MNPEEYQKVKAVFQSVLEIEPPKRAAFINKTCQDNADLRREIERLLKNYDSGFLEEPAVPEITPFIGESLEANAKNLTRDEPPAIIGRQLNHFKIESLLGAGGMGKVYLAEDTMLGRKVALKLLTPHLVTDENSRKRFLREARLASSLDHPNICTIHEIGESDGEFFISMQ
jgi:hypothetical protein